MGCGAFCRRRPGSRTLAWIRVTWLAHQTFSTMDLAGVIAAPVFALTVIVPFLCLLDPGPALINMRALSRNINKRQLVRGRAPEAVKRITPVNRAL